MCRRVRLSERLGHHRLGEGKSVRMRSRRCNEFGANGRKRLGRRDPAPRLAARQQDAVRTKREAGMQRAPRLAKSTRAAEPARAKR